MAERKHHDVLSDSPAVISEDPVQRLVDENSSIASGSIIEDEKTPGSFWNRQMPPLWVQQP